ncbi:uncharacterized protein LOC102713149 isoform X3 [Oryza brachyantha]|uniref:uncharacterized protein LOC102713149 isoform X3 n=1 Tax=Oryza brachyantha TaxID=4533 RepID=UPI001AD9ED66|nr:uncharacterized protein LOC102713149 isoform X3 [Oryza brachyantha]
MQKLEAEIAETQCILETIFLLSFFDIMVHLMVHLPAQARIGGSVLYRNMYPVERFLMRLKGYVRTRSHPEGSIAESYIFDESLTFCSQYLHGCETRYTRKARNDDGSRNINYEGKMQKRGGSRLAPLTDYERRRDDNIAENKIKMAALNLEFALQSLRTEAASSSQQAKKTSKKRKAVRSVPCDVPIEPRNLHPRLARIEITNEHDTNDLCPRLASNGTTNDHEGRAEDPQLMAAENNRDSNGAQPKKRNGRKFTRKDNIWYREDEALIKMEFNEFDQPVGKAAVEFPNVVGSLVRTKGFPLCHDDWRRVNADAKPFIIDALEKWKDYKADLKKAHFNETKTVEELIAACDDRVQPEDWVWLVDHWLSPEAKARSMRGKMNRAKLLTPHTSGSKSFARARHEWAEKLGYMPRRDEMYIKTHTRKNGTQLRQAEASIRDLQEAVKDHPELKEKNVHEGDVFSHVFGRDPRGYVRSVGFGPTPSTLGMHEHRKYTQTKVQMALRGQHKAEKQVTVLQGTVDELRDEVAELKRGYK